MDTEQQKSTLEEKSVRNELEEEETSTANYQSDINELHHEQDEVLRPDENSNENS